MGLKEQQKVRAKVERLVRDAHLEVIPLKGVEESLGVLPVGSTVSITCSPKFGVARTLEYSARAALAGHRVVPHLAARQVADEAELRAFLGRLELVGIAGLFVIGGDAAVPAGGYDAAGDVLEALSGSGHGITSVGVACYPDGHPKIPDEALIEALLRKQPHADYMVNQLCFDPGVLVSWLRRARRAGVTLPLRLGLAGPLKTRKLIELSLRIGVGSSLRYLTKQRGMIDNLLLGNTYQPEKFLWELGDGLLSEELGIESLHLFSFNQLDVTVGWQRRIAHTAQGECGHGG